MIDLSVAIGNVSLASPVILASGCGGYGDELRRVVGFDASQLGAFVTPSITRDPRSGGPPPRIDELPYGLLHDAGLPNPGVDAFVSECWPGLSRLGCPVVVSVAAENTDDLRESLERLADAALAPAAIELCLPARDAHAAQAWLSAARQACHRPLWAKPICNAGVDPVEIARGAHDGGADAVTVGQMIPGLRIDWRSRRPQLAAGVGWMSGPAIKPTVLHAVHRVRTALPDMPIVASGGCVTADDVLDMIVAGAAAVQIGTAALVSPLRLMAVHDELRDALADAGIDAVAPLCGTLVMPPA